MSSELLDSAGNSCPAKTTASVKVKQGRLNIFRCMDELLNDRKVGKVTADGRAHGSVGVWCNC